jgi:hypothetical protein
VNPVNRPERQALAMAAVLTIVAVLVVLLLQLHGNPPSG